MKIEENAVFLTVPCADFCESPYRYSGFDLKITPPFDDRLAEVADKLFGKAAIVFDDGGRASRRSDALDLHKAARFS